MSAIVYKYRANFALLGAFSATFRAVPSCLRWTPIGRWAGTSQRFTLPPTTSSFLLASAAASHFDHPDCRPGASTRLASPLRQPAQAPSQCDRIARVNLGFRKRRKPDFGLGLSRARSWRDRESLGGSESVWEGKSIFLSRVCLALQALAADSVGRLAAGNSATHVRLWRPQHIQLFLGRN